MSKIMKHISLRKYQLLLLSTLKVGSDGHSKILDKVSNSDIHSRLVDYQSGAPLHSTLKLNHKYSTRQKLSKNNKHSSLVAEQSCTPRFFTLRAGP